MVNKYQECGMCGLIVHHSAVDEFAAFGEVKECYSAGYLDVCGKCAVLASKHVNFTGLKSKKAIEKTREIFRSGLEPSLTFCKITNSGYYKPLFRRVVRDMKYDTSIDPKHIATAMICRFPLMRDIFDCVRNSNLEWEVMSFFKFRVTQMSGSESVNDWTEEQVRLAINEAMLEWDL